MVLEIEFYRTEQYLPTKRHRKPRTCGVQDSVSVDIKELSSAEFPVAFVVHDYHSLFEGATSYSDFNGRKNDFVLLGEEIRTFDGKLYGAVRITHGSAISTIFESPQYIASDIRLQAGCRAYYGYIGRPEDSIFISSDADEWKTKISKCAQRYLLYDGKVWTRRGEPMYEIATFGLGYNHGGTSLFITGDYNSNVSHERYFNALCYDEAVERATEIALKRGDTKSIDGIKKRDKYIEVIMPEMVRRNPSKDHGAGDAFINDVETMIPNAGNSTVAGILAMTMVATNLAQT